MAKKETRTGAQALVESLERAGTRTVFGYPGGMVLDVFDALARTDIHFILGRHEQGCVHMADGYARATGRPGVCIVTSGPGAANTVTALATANIDGVPLVVVTGQVSLKLIGTDAFQETDTTGITRAVSKHNFLVHSADEIPETVAQAFYIATHGKPGPVVIDLPKDCQEAQTAAQYPERVSLRAYHPENYATAGQIARLAKLLNEAKRPVIYAGGGAIASGAAKEVAQLAHKADIPVATTLMGLGAFDENDPLSLRMAGMHGSFAANSALNEADFILALGVRFSDRVTGKVSRYAPKAKIAHVDCDCSSIGKNVKVSLGINADIKDVLTTVASRIKRAERGEWLARIEELRRDEDAAFRRETARLPDGQAIRPRTAMEAVGRLAKGRAIFTTDVGQHQMWAAQYLRHTKPRRFLTSGGMGTMGFGIPAAIGAAIARPDLKSIAILGDGGAQMTFEEVVVAVEHDLPVTFIVFNNECLGMVRQLQELFYRNKYSASILSPEGRGANEKIRQTSKKYLPDFVALAKAHGALAWRVEDAAKLEATLAKALHSKKTSLVEIAIDPRTNVYPMIPSGKTVAETLFGGGAE